MSFFKKKRDGDGESSMNTTNVAPGTLGERPSQTFLTLGT